VPEKLSTIIGSAGDHYKRVRKLKIAKRIPGSKLRMEKDAPGGLIKDTMQLFGVDSSFNLFEEIDLKKSRDIDQNRKPLDSVS
jgi:hypothetical protein